MRLQTCQLTALLASHCLATADTDSPEVDCNDVAAIDPWLNNQDCLDRCHLIQKKGGNPLDDASFTSGCSVEKIEIVDGVVASTGSCFDNWIFGYSEPPELAGFVYLDNFLTAALCQYECQIVEGCVRFQFTATNIGGDANDRVTRCVFKNADQVSSILEGHPGDQGFDSDTCDTTKGCSTISDCLKCGDEPRCAWRSDYHVSGWRHCSDVRDTCDPHPSTPPPSTTTSTTESTTTATTKATTTTTKATTTTTKATTTTTKATTTTTRPVTVTTSPAADTTTTGGGGNGTKIATGVASAAGGLALLGGALRYFNRPAEDAEAAFVADEAQLPELREREAVAATDDMYA
ncbi:hypothetical protein GNI_137720 [Gregarina niphandrodes]|uniref:Apple domain-containing protein n=1 Tax=Gregarina niphandrodes TaxID=110365 RepID=A0A023B0P2_GRENI|nr:hypothetical protein GNI_137720 [Gregarina niphandrodes]EZG45626.1 hypothetical protein GNI_137720 [Gregarina niphandrodes]|eukprot:XP_011132468.1 hypothetical protein GNI_137720 [Gregarina niphandrodes]